jgi:hypothetical protein
MGELSLLIGSVIARSVLNLDSSRCGNPSLERRKEGWTEIWGEPAVAVQDCWNDDEASISR